MAKYCEELLWKIGHCIYIQGIYAEIRTKEKYRNDDDTSLYKCPKICSNREHWGLTSASRDCVELENQKDFMDGVVLKMQCGRIIISKDEWEENVSLCEQIKMQWEYQVQAAFKKKCVDCVG